MLYKKDLFACNVMEIILIANSNITLSERNCPENTKELFIAVVCSKSNLLRVFFHM